MCSSLRRRSCGCGLAARTAKGQPKELPVNQLSFCRHPALALLVETLPVDTFYRLRIAVESQSRENCWNVMSTLTLKAYMLVESKKYKTVQQIRFREVTLGTATD